MFFSDHGNKGQLKDSLEFQKGSGQSGFSDQRC